ncbi:MAG: SDR family oxidoreductase [Alphaproteobacteria bacterium]
MKIEGSVALVTGANRGIGHAFVEVLLARGAARVYAAARHPDQLDFTDQRVEKIGLDITDQAQISAAAAQCDDVNLLINNAGVLYTQGYITGYDEAHHKNEMDVNLWGTWDMCRAFAPVLRRNAPAGIVNISSIVGKVAMPMIGPYSASKAALWALTRGIRAELSRDNVLVMSVFPGLTDTRMAEAIDAPKTPPAEVAGTVLDGVEVGEEDVVVCENAIEIEAGLRADPKGVEKDLAKALP